MRARLGPGIRSGRAPRRHGAYTRETAARVTAPPHDRHGVYTLVKNAQVGNMWWDVAFWTGKGGKSGAAARAAGLTGMGVITGAHEVAPSQVLEIEHRA